MANLEFPEHLPAVLIGVLGSRPTLTNELPWAHSVHHQHGGHACLQAELYGVVLPLQAVPACAALMAGFDALALDSPSKSAFASTPELASLHLSCGEPYSREELDVIQRFLGRAKFTFPAVTSGTEALLELATASATAFLGWPPLMLEMPLGCALDEPDARHLDIGPLGIYSGWTLSPAALRRLREVVGEDVRAYLLWNNSD